MPATSDRLSRAISNNSGPPDLGSAGTPELFVYGSLIIDEVIRTLIDRVPAFEAATAPGWRVAQLLDRPYPGLVAAADGQAPGRLYIDLTEDELTLLDAFEDPTYELRAVELSVRGSALAYVWPKEASHSGWAPSVLDDGARRAYIERCAGWRAHYDQADLRDRAPGAY